jgi:phospholipid transport system substrate-binding protein
MKLRAHFLAIFFLVFSINAFADAAPVSMLKQVSSQMLSELDKSQGHINRQVINGIVHRVLLPHVELEAMSRSVVGKQYWSQATPAQKEQFKNAFTSLVVNTYSAPLSSYNGETVEFRPLRDDSGSRVQVESVISRKNGQKIPVSYRLVQAGGNWKVYDFSVEGISMISSYRSQFDSILQQQGMSGLLNKLNSGK